MATQSFPIYISMLLGLLAILSLYGSGSCSFDTNFSIEEATLKDFQLAFYQNKLTSRQLVEFYLEQVRRLNPILKGIIEVNPDALNQASQADLKRKRSSLRSLSPLHGIPVLVKDNIATKDKLNTTAGSFALLGSIVPRDAGVVTKLRKAGAIIFGKASLSEWSGFRSYEPPNGWSARGGQGKIAMGVLVLLLSAVSARSEYYSKTVPRVQLKEKVTNLHFFLFDILSGKKPSAVEVARSNITIGDQSATPFGSVYAVDDPLREGPDPESKVIGNARGLYVSASQGADLCLAMYIDYGFTTGPFNGSSLSVFSRNPVTERRREVAIVGGRGKFRMARGFAKLKTHYLNVSNGDAIIEYNVTVFHY